MTPWSHSAFALLLILVADASAAESASTQTNTHGPYRLEFGHYTNATLTVIDDVGVLAPILQQFDKADPDIADGVRPIGLSDLRPTFASVVQETGAGSAVPYFLSATIGALNDADTYLTIWSQGMANRTFMPTPSLDGIRLNVHIFGDRAKFDRWAQGAVQAHTPDAAYDPRTQTIGVYVDVRLFQYFGYQAGWQGYPPGYFVRELRLYVEQLFTRTVSHETFHVLQARDANPALQLATVREGGAVVASAKIDTGREIRLLSLDMATSPRNYRRMTGQCVEATAGGVKDAYLTDQYARAAALIARTPDFSIVQFMLDPASNASFYAGPAETLADHYAVAAVAVEFISSLGGEAEADWTAAFQSVRLHGFTPDLQARYGPFDAYFRSEITAELSPARLHEMFQVSSAAEAAAHAEGCTEDSPPEGLVWGQIAHMFAPAEAGAALDLGDIFSNSHFVLSDGSVAQGHSLASLDYYRQAQMRLAAIEPAWADCSPQSHPHRLADVVRLHARLGERYALIGDFTTALYHFQCAVAVTNANLETREAELDPLLPAIFDADTELKAYQRAIQLGLERRREVADMIRQGNDTDARIIAEINDPARIHTEPSHPVMNLCVTHLLSLSVLDGEMTELQQRLAPGTAPPPAGDISLCNLRIRNWRRE